MLGLAAAACTAALSGAYADDVPAAKAVTFYQDVLPILAKNCQVCHREGGANLGGMVAPMAFTTFESTRPWAKAIADNVSTKKMPPWHASKDQHGVFANERTITPAEADTLVAWAKSGAAKGNPSDAPTVKEWPQTEGWSIGTPDVVLKMSEKPFFVNDDVVDTYEYFNTTITKEMLPEPRWIKAIEFRPGSKVVHHIIATPLGGIAPGNDPTVFPDGMGRLLRPDTNVTWQMHYHKEPGPGTGSYDQSEAAIVFYPKDAKISHVLRDESLGRFDFRVPAGDPNYSIKTEYTFDEDSKIVSMMPHMHVRGKSAKYEAFYPDGTSKVLLDVPNYDFNWQTRYQYKDFEFVPKGTKLVLTTAWDNSAANPNNPDPKASVTFGEPTTAEMSFGFMNYIKAVDQEDIEAALKEQGDGFGGRRGGRQNFDLGQLVGTFDVDGDGKLAESEAPEFMKRFFPIVDADKDGFLTKEELTAAAKLMEHRGGNRGGQRDQLPTEKPQL
jgi:mono/diheme cytochrome c family protein